MPRDQQSYLFSTVSSFQEVGRHWGSVVTGGTQVSSGMQLNKPEPSQKLLSHPIAAAPTTKTSPHSMLGTQGCRLNQKIY
eukprot:6020128-Amphidinium_carterae.1